MTIEAISTLFRGSLFNKYPSTEVQNGLKFSNTITMAIGIIVSAHTYVTKHETSNSVRSSTIFI